MVFFSLVSQYQHKRRRRIKECGQNVSVCSTLLIIDYRGTKSASRVRERERETLASFARRREREREIY